MTMALSGSYANHMHTFQIINTPAHHQSILWRGLPWCSKSVKTLHKIIKNDVIVYVNTKKLI